MHRGGNVLGNAAVSLFFLSYPRTPQIDVRDSLGLDIWVAQLFNDLCASVKQRGDLPRSANVGFMARESRVGDEWPRELSRALETCRVFVPLYSLQYFADEGCGREWSYFAGRARNRAEEIVPALWSPVDKRLLPAVAREVRLGREDDDAYESRGFYGIMKVSRYRDAYEHAVGELARKIVAAAERSQVPEGPPAEYQKLKSAFGVESAGGHWNRVLRITVVAPRQGELPCEREDASYYGQSAWAWNPYAPFTKRPIAEEVAKLAWKHRDRFQVEVGDLGQHQAGLLSGRPEAGPQILLIDPWALLLPRYQDVLQRIDAIDAPWVRAVILLSDSDMESQEQARKLRAVLYAVLGRKLAQAKSSTAHEVRTLADFRSVLPLLIDAAAQGYRRRTPTYPPVGPALERPRLGFVPDLG